jgi:hypothetical protein
MPRKVGHVEIAGDQQVIPGNLITLLQQEGIRMPTEPSQLGDPATLLARLYLKGSGAWPNG